MEQLTARFTLILQVTKSVLIVSVLSDVIDITYRTDSPRKDRKQW